MQLGAQLEAAPERGFAWYMTGSASWFLAIGLQSVIVSSLVALALDAGSAALASAQIALQVPAVALMLLGGAVADRTDRRRLLIRLYFASVALTLGLLAGVEMGGLSLALVIAYGLAMGSVTAFLTPSRDALLSDVAGADLMRAVTLLTLLQWAMQALGSSFGLAGRAVGIAPLIGLQAAVLLVGAFALSRLPESASTHQGPQRALHVRDLTAGVRAVVRSPVLRSVALLALALGALFIGPFQVVFPLLVRDYYHGDVGDLALLFTAFPVGTITGSALILWRGGIRRKGAAQLFALGFGSLCLGSLGLGLPFWGALVAVALFGLGGAFFMNAGRTLFQEHAPVESRGSVLACYALAFMGSSSLLGAPLAGVLHAHVGPLRACALAAGAMALLVATVTLTTRVRKLE